MKSYRIFICGEVMTGRGIDQILKHPNRPNLYESYVKNARDYVRLAESVNGKIDYPVSDDYIWGEALSVWDQFQPDVRIINLETAITQSEDYMRDKGIHYRMHPLNVGVLTSAKISACILANNHIMDWGIAGLLESVSTLKQSKILYAGAGHDLDEAMSPAMINLDEHHRILIFAAGMLSSGVPASWCAETHRPGLYYLPAANKQAQDEVIEIIRQFKRPGDLVIFSVHWGSNWGYEVSNTKRAFAHNLIEYGGVDVIYGHSSHHPRPIEIYQGKPIFYGCGDFINDYEGISGNESYRGDLTLMYFLDFDRTTLQLNKMTLVPMQIKKFRLEKISPQDHQWLEQTLKRSSYKISSTSIYLERLF